MNLSFTLSRSATVYKALSWGFSVLNVYTRGFCELTQPSQSLWGWGWGAN